MASLLLLLGYNNHLHLSRLHGRMNIHLDHVLAQRPDWFLQIYPLLIHMYATRILDGVGNILIRNGAGEPVPLTCCNREGREGLCRESLPLSSLLGSTMLPFRLLFHLSKGSFLAGLSGLFREPPRYQIVSRIPL